jgi:hypothetical protein
VRHDPQEQVPRAAWHGDQRTTAVSAAVYDICEYLVELADDDRLDTDFGPVEATAIYRWLSPRHSS